MITIEKLKKFCSTDPYRAKLMHPHRLQFADGNSYLCATNGYYLIIAQDNKNTIVLPELPPSDDKMPKTEDAVTKFYPPKASIPEITCQIDKLREFAGVGAYENVCQKCLGTGETGKCPSCNGQGGTDCPACGQEIQCCDCNNSGAKERRDCQGSGYLGDTHRPGFLGTILVNLNYLSRVLSVFESETVKLYPYQSEHTYLIVSDNINCLLMGVRYDAVNDKTVFPKFEFTESAPQTDPS